MLRALVIFGLFALSQALPASTPKSKALVPRPKINGGEEVTISQFPFQASILYFGIFMCGGSIIGSNYVLTAAQCFRISPNSASFTILVGTDHIQSEGGTNASVRIVYKHPNYYFSPNSVSYDVAVVETTSPFTYGDTIQPISLSFDPVEVGYQVTVIGFGDEEDQGEEYDALKAVSIPVVDKTVCQEGYSDLPITIGKETFCAGEEDKGVCSGDGGGPVIVGDYQVGVASLQYQCSETEVPSVFVDLSNEKVASFLRRFV